METVGVDTNVL